MAFVYVAKMPYWVNQPYQKSEVNIGMQTHPTEALAEFKSRRQQLIAQMVEAVSYTHLDVYKRQVHTRNAVPARFNRPLCRNIHLVNRITSVAVT